MAMSRLVLHEKLCETLGSRNVYFQPPDNLTMKYPAIVYNVNNYDDLKASDGVHVERTQYQLILIDRNPDSPILQKLRHFSYCSLDRSYRSDNLNHYVFTLYF